MNIPKDHRRAMPYLILKGAEKFIEFTHAVFGAEVTAKHLRDDTGGIMHAEIIIGDSVIMFAEATDQWGPQPGGLFIYVENADATYKTALANGAASIMEPSDQSYGRSCGVKDPAGNSWWITSV